MIIIENWKDYVIKNVNIFKLEESLIEDGLVVVLHSVSALVIAKEEIQELKRYYKSFEQDLWERITKMSEMSDLKVSFRDKKDGKQKILNVKKEVENNDEQANLENFKAEIEGYTCNDKGS